MTFRPKIGLALGSGAVRGLAHVGVIKVLEENNISIDYVAGTSIGAIVGALYCSGAPLELAAKVVQNIPTKWIIDFSKNKKGLIAGKKIEEILRVMLRCKSFEELKKPLNVVATNLLNGEKVVFDKGDIITALRASFSIPGVFTPVTIDDKVLVDGGVVDRIPAGVVKKMGADIVIGVDVGFRPGDNYNPESIIDILFQTLGIMEMQLLRHKIAKCDILISPQVLHLNPYTLENCEKFLEAGVAAAQENIDKIKTLIYEYSNTKLLEKINENKTIEL